MHCFLWKKISTFWMANWTYNIWVVTWLQKLTPEGWLELHRLKLKGTDQAAEESGVRTCWLRPHCEVNSAAYGHILSAAWTAYSNDVLSSSGSRFSIASKGCIQIKCKAKKKPLQAKRILFDRLRKKHGPWFPFSWKSKQKWKWCVWLFAYRAGKWDITSGPSRCACGYAFQYVAWTDVLRGVHLW